MKSDPNAESWDGDYTGKVDPALLRMQTTLDDYFDPRIANSKRPNFRQSWETYQKLVGTKLEQGDELWVWQDGQGMGSARGLAIVRDAEIIHAWLTAFS